MIKLKKKPEIICGLLKPEASKSIANRVLLIQKISGKKPFQPIDSSADDVKRMQQLLNADTDIYDAADAGTVFRFMTAYLAVTTTKTVTLTGSKRMKVRPVKPLVDALNSLGCRIRYAEKTDFPPLAISPPSAISSETQIDASVSSQFISALMMIAPTLPEGLVIRLKQQTVSMPYIMLTADIMSYFGCKPKIVENEIYIKAGRYIPRDIKPEADWSSSASWITMVALMPGSSLKIAGLSQDSFQADKVILELLESYGLKSQFEKSGLRLSSFENNKKDRLEADFTNYPDLLPVLTAFCLCRNLDFSFSGTQHIETKESKRVSVMSEIASALNYEVETGKDFFKGKYKAGALPGSMIFDTYKDHRIAMSLAILSLFFPQIVIKDPAVVNKSYPDFWDKLAEFGIVFE